MVSSFSLRALCLDAVPLKFNVKVLLAFESFEVDSIPVRVSCGDS